MTHRQAGYSLFEVLVAFTVLSFVLAALIPGQARLLGRANFAEERLLAKDFAFSRLDRLGISIPIELGRVVEKYGNWTVIQDIAVESTPHGNAPAVKRIMIEVRTGNGNNLAQVSVLRPKL